MATASREFQIFVKPIGAICNLDCRYCYYLKKQHLYPNGESFRMNDDLLEEYIVQHIEASPKPLIHFSWHGGEPTLLGLDYFRKIVALERKHRPSGRQIINGIQTNGTTLDEEWCRFLAAEGFYAGLSMDGPREFHDRCYCRECEVLAMCNGGCPKDRFIRTPNGEEGLNYLCAGFKRFFMHSRPYLQRLASLLQAGEPTERVMHLVRSEDAKTSPLAGRNDPCPCGSGRKYKRCCLGKLPR